MVCWFVDLYLLKALDRVVRVLILALSILGRELKILSRLCCWVETGWLLAEVGPYRIVNRAHSRR
jgi:hypothetical protein